MGYIPNFAYDIFLSYARNDDEGEWVAKFRKILHAKLKKRLGVADDLRIYFDHDAVQSNHDLASIKLAASESAVFLAICSPSYALRPWTRAELEAFVKGNTDYTGRIFAVEHLPLDPGQTYPEPLESQHREPFFIREIDYSNTPMALAPDDRKFENLVDKIAAQIKGQLEEMRNAAGRAVSPAAAETESSRYHTVLLAQPDGDTPRDRLKELRIYLDGAGVPVTRKGGFPQGAQEFRAEFAKDLERAGLAVHLLGKDADRSPDDESPSYTQIQETVMRQKGVAILRWRDPDIKGIDDMADAAQRELLKCAEAGSFEEFKAKVVKAAAKPVVTKAAGTEGLAPKKGIVFVDAHLKDKDLAEDAFDAFGREGFASLMPFWEGDTADFVESLQDGIKRCDVLVVIYGQVTPRYVRERCLEYVTMRRQAADTKPARIVAIIYSPPDQKAPVGVFASEMEHYVITPDGTVPEGMRKDRGSPVFACRDLNTAISQVIEKYGP